MLLIGLIIAAVVAAFVANDASKRGMNAVGWCFGVFLLLIVFLPLYLLVRTPLLPQYQPEFPQSQPPAKLCRNCGKYSTYNARFCTECGQGIESQITSAPITVSVPGQGNPHTTGNAIFIAFLILLCLMFLIYAVNGTLQSGRIPDSFSTSIESKVAADAVEQYEIAKRNGNRIDVCVHAGLVKAAYLQAKDEVSYKRWVRTERTDCDEAGVNLP
jgi:MFS family permease